MKAPKKLLTKEVSLYFAVNMRNAAWIAIIENANRLSLNVPPNIIEKNGPDNVKAITTDVVEYLFLSLISFIFLNA